MAEIITLATTNLSHSYKTNKVFKATKGNEKYNFCIFSTILIIFETINVLHNVFLSVLNHIMI